MSSFTAQQKKTIQAVLETFIAPCSTAETDELVKKYAKNPKHADSIRAYCALNGGDMVEDVCQVAESRMNAEKLGQLGQVLDLLDSSIATFLFSNLSTWSSFSELPREQRADLLTSFSTSWLETKRAIFRGLISLCLFTFYTSVSETDRIRTVWQAVGYPGPDPERNNEERYASKQFFDFRPNMIDVHQDMKLECDVVVVGSGCGGGVVADTLSAAGYRVVVVEKGAYTHQSEMSQLEQDAYFRMYEGSGLLQTEGDSISILAGSCLGGGSAVNWSCSLVTPFEVRKEWAERYGLKYFMSPEFSQDIDDVSRRMGVHTDGVELSAQNEKLYEGCRRMGMTVKRTPQNGSGKHSCGWCGLGCRYGEKQGSNVSFLVEAAKRGTRFLEQCFVKRVLKRKGVARGVEAVKNGHKVVIQARAVVASCGSIHTPSLLQRSGLRNMWIGRNLRLHPVSLVMGTFEQPVRNYEGTILTVAAEVEDVDGYGAKLECPMIHAGSAALVKPWRSNMEHREHMLELNYKSYILVLARDKGSGSVFNDAEGMPKLEYSISDHDRETLVKGIIRAAEIMIAAGAMRVSSLHLRLPEYEVTDLGAADEKFDQWKELVKSVGLRKMEASFFSAHQMGSCRMSATSGRGAVKPSGETWEVNNLFVADASLMPTPSGANPMITTLAMSRHVAKTVQQALASEATASKL